MKLRVDGREVYGYTGARQPQAGQAAVLFVHGAGLDHTVWTLQARYFAHHGSNAYALDLPGHGRSEGPPLASIDAAADWLAACMTALGCAPALLVGHSLGSLVCLATAARHASSVRGLALVGTAVPMPVAAPLQDAADADSHAAFDMINVWGHSLAAQLGGGPHAPGMWLTGTALRLLERSAPGVLAGDLRMCNDYTAGEADAAAVRCPALLVLGERDVMTPPRASAGLQRLLGDPQVTVLPGCGHMHMGERPDAVLDALIGFDARLRDGAGDTHRR